jgi:hypothetical protein
MTASVGYARDIPVPVPAPVSADAVVAGSVNPAALGEFHSLVTKEESLLGYWPLAQNLDAAKGRLILQPGKKKLIFRPGPQGQDSSLDLSNGGYLCISPTDALDSPELTIELVCKIKYLADGCLFGLRNGGATRFSLHYTTDSSMLKLWNGSQVIDFEADTAMKMGEWYHVALAVSGTESIVWVNGKRCEPSGNGGMALGSKGLPFLLGTSDYETGKTERAEILAAHLAIYKTMLGNEAIVGRVKALGWSDKLKPQPRRSTAEEIARIDSRISRIKKDYGVDVHYKYSHKEFIPAVWHDVGAGTQLPFEHVPKVLDEIEGFLAVVPKPVSRKNLDGIYLFDDLKIEGDGMGAMAYGKSIYLCCIRPVFDIRCSLYHEFSHILQVAYPVDDETWVKLLPKDFKYGGRTNLDPFGFDDTLRTDGFVINYSTGNRHEDIAVLSDYVFVRRDQTMDLMEAYPAIKHKVATLVKYYKTISPDYDFSHYDTLLRGKKAPPAQTATHQ